MYIVNSLVIVIMIIQISKGKHGYCITAVCLDRRQLSTRQQLVLFEKFKNSDFNCYWYHYAWFNAKGSFWIMHLNSLWWIFAVASFGAEVLQEKVSKSTMSASPSNPSTGPLIFASFPAFNTSTISSSIITPTNSELPESQIQSQQIPPPSSESQIQSQQIPTQSSTSAFNDMPETTRTVSLIENYTTLTSIINSLITIPSIITQTQVQTSILTEVQISPTTLIPNRARPHMDAEENTAISTIQLSSCIIGLFLLFFY